LGSHYLQFISDFIGNLESANMLTIPKSFTYFVNVRSFMGMHDFSLFLFTDFQLKMGMCDP